MFWNGMAVTWLALAAMGWNGCSKDSTLRSSESEAGFPDQEARDFTLTESSAGRKNWTLWATHAAMYHDRSIVDARTVRIEFYDAGGARYSTLLADQGIVHQRTNDLLAHGHVRITTESGVVMETDSLRWDNARGTIESDARVRLTRGADVMTGYGFESDPSLDHFKIRRGVQAEVQEEGLESDGGSP